MRLSFVAIIAGLAVMLVGGAKAAETGILAGWRAPQIDFSHAGYRGGGLLPPMAPTTLVVEPGPGDDTDRIMAAIRVIERMSANSQGHRGVVQLAPGDFEIAGQVRIEASGVVVRGAGAGEAGSVLIATGHDRRALIAIAATDEAVVAGDVEHTIAEAPVGTRSVTLDTVAGLRVGDAVTVTRPSTADWITHLGMDAFQGWRPEGRLNWKPGSRDIVWDRRITAIEGRTVTLDAPLTTAIEAVWGGGVLRKGPSAARLSEVGVEGVKLVSASDPTRPMDEDHSWFAIAVDRAEDVWIRNVAAEGFASYVIDLGATSRRVTVQDVSASRPVSELGGLRRRVFYTAGQQALFVRCDSRDGIHDFALGHVAAGPNVFLDCTSIDAHGDSGPLESWASGALYDGVKVRGGGLNLTHRGRDAQGAGWSAANSLLWNCEATEVAVRSPPGALNAAVGCRGEVSGDGVIEDPRIQPGRDFYRATPQQPPSLYRAQLETRLGPAALAALAPVTLSPVPPNARRLSEAEVVAYARTAHPTAESHPLTIVDGQFVIDGRPAWRRALGFSFFQAQMVPALAPAFGPALTRFAPGLEGGGLTDDLPALAASLNTGDVVSHNYGLWYDRRRVDHDFYGSPDQKDGEVWGPFMELPWARSGTGRAWDGLSQYDLTRFNPWFFDRIQTFADLAAQRGVVLYHQMYMQHWLLESRAHYVDFPWRPMNAIQATGMPNEVPAATVFWDVSDPMRRDLHRLYIRHTLDVLKDRPNVVIGLDPEYTGPLEFTRFWLDTIAAWEAETGTPLHVVLEAPKDQIDAVLDDPVRSRIVDGIEIHHWAYRPDGSLFAVVGGINKAPREQVDAIARPEDLVGVAEADVGAARQALWRSTPEMRYRLYREYRDRRDGLVVVGAEDVWPGLSLAVEKHVPAAVRATLRSGSGPVTETGKGWSLGSAGGASLIYSLDGSVVTLSQPLGGAARAVWIGEDGTPLEAALAAGTTTLTPPPAMAGRPVAVWIRSAI